MAKWENKRIREFKRKYLKNIKDIFSPYLVLIFGSYVRGENLKSSDVDLIIVSDFFEKIPYPDRMYEVIMQVGIDEPVDILCYTKDEFERKKQEIGIVRSATKEGKLLYSTEIFH